jgi:hypothetical protein
MRQRRWYKLQLVACDATSLTQGGGTLAKEPCTLIDLTRRIDKALIMVSRVQGTRKKITWLSEAKQVRQVKGGRKAQHEQVTCKWCL